MRFLDYIFSCAYFHYKHYANDGTVLASSILYTCFICAMILHPLYTSLELLCLGHNNYKAWQELIIESPIFIYLLYRYIKNKDEILNRFANHKYSKTFSFIFMFFMFMGMFIIPIILSNYLRSQILKRGLEGSWNIPEIFSEFTGA